MKALAIQPNLYLASIRAERDRRYARDAKANAAEVRARCQTLAGFLREAWPILEPRATYAHGWHIDAICAHLEAVTFGRINRLLINVPPGSSKSLIVSVVWPAWEWAMGFASYRYLTTSFNDGPVKRDTRKSRDLIQSEWYQTLWPEVRPVIHLRITHPLEYITQNPGICDRRMATAPACYSATVEPCGE